MTNAKISSQKEIIFSVFMFWLWFRWIFTTCSKYAVTWSFSACKKPSYFLLFAICRWVYDANAKLVYKSSVYQQNGPSVMRLHSCRGCARCRKRTLHNAGGKSNWVLVANLPDVSLPFFGTLSQVIPRHLQSDQSPLNNMATLSWFFRDCAWIIQQWIGARAALHRPFLFA